MYKNQQDWRTRFCNRLPELNRNPSLQVDNTFFDAPPTLLANAADNADNWAFFFSLMLKTGVGTSQDIFYFTKHPSETTVAAGASVALECEISHAGIENYWSLNDTRVPNTPRRHKYGRNLLITRADHVLDAGEYACIAENATTGYSLTSRTATLNIACKFFLIFFYDGPWKCNVGRDKYRNGFRVWAWCVGYITGNGWGELARKGLGALPWHCTLCFQPFCTFRCYVLKYVWSVGTKKLN